MAEEAALLPGTLDLLILKAVSLAPEHGYGVLLRIEQIRAARCSSSRVRSIPPSRGWSIRGCSRVNGEPRTTIGAPSFTG